MMDSPGPSAPGLSPYLPALRYFFLVIYTSVGLRQPPEEGWSGGWGGSPNFAVNLEVTEVGASYFPQNDTRKGTNCRKQKVGDPMARG